MAGSATNLDYSSFSGASRLLIEASMVSETAIYHAQIKNRIQELEKEALRIGQEISALKGCHNATTATNRLPPEVLALIFSFVSKFYTSTSILDVTHVCRHWRLIALDHPQFFADLGGAVLQSEALTRTMIGMSKEAPLTFTWLGGKESAPSEEPLNLKALLSATCRVHDRLKSFVFWKAGDEEYDEDDEEDETFTLQDAFRSWYEPGCRAPILEKLSIMNIVVDGYYESNGDFPDIEKLQSGHLKQTRMFPREHVLLKGGFPALRDMTLSHIGLAWKYLPFGPSLVHLRLLEDHSFQGRLCRPSTSEFIDSLKQMPRLETIKLHNFLPTIDKAPDGEVFTFPSTLQTLDVIDDSKFLSHFLRISRVLDHVSVALAFFQHSIDTNKIGETITYLKKAIGEIRSQAGATNFVDFGSLCFQIWFDDRESPERAQDLEGYLAPIWVDCRLGPTPSLEPEEYYSVITQHFDISCIHSLQLVSTDLKIYEDEAWSFFSHLPKLETLLFHNTQFTPFISQLKPQDSSSSTEGVGNGHRCPFPALKTIIGKSPRRGPALQSQDQRGGTSAFTDILNSRKQLGCPLHKVDFTESEVSEEVATQLRESVLGLVVCRSVDSDLIL